MGKISRIQLRGISRTPSDRLTTDGGCAESLNVSLDNTELAPAFVPDDVTGKLGLPDNLQAEKVFVHKTANYENFILAQSDRVIYFSEGQYSEILTLHSEEQVKDITSIGNTLIVLTSKNLYYLLNKDGEYKLLGNKVPFPYIDFRKKGVDKEYSFSLKRRWDSSVGNMNNYPLMWFLDPSKADTQSYQYAVFTDDSNAILPEEELWTEENFRNKAEYKQFQEEIDNLCNEQRAKIVEDKHFYTGMFVRYAVTLYDDTKLSSMPIYIPHSSPRIDISAKTSMLPTTDGSGQYVVKYIENKAAAAFSAYDIGVKCNNIAELADWADVIKSVDIYVSDQKDVFSARYPIIHDREIELGASGDNTQLRTTTGSLIYGEAENVEVAINDQSSIVYRIKSLPLVNIYDDKNGLKSSSLSKEILALERGITIDMSDYESIDALRSQERLNGDDMKHYPSFPDRIDRFNNALLLLSPSSVLTYDHNGLNAINVTEEATDLEDYEVFYKYEIQFVLKTQSGDKMVSAGPFWYRVYVADGKLTKEEPLLYQTFPDSRAYKMMVKVSRHYDSKNEDPMDVRYGYFNMKPHPNLDLAYRADIKEDSFWELYPECDAGESFDFIEDQNIDEQENKLSMSEINNPFFFPLGRTYTFQSKVLGVAIATTALSQGQFGQFPLYVFTEDGIWAMETAADGSFVTSKPLSRDVCTNPASITSIDNAVVFVTDKGVMLLQGSQVVNISPYMNGKHYTIEETAKVILEKTIEETIAKISKTPVDQMAQVIQNEVSQSISQQETRASIERTAHSIIAEEEFFKDLLPILSDSTHFMAFIKDATIAYDYPGQRLIFIKKDEKYQYIYKLDSNTWHKTAYGLNLLNPINSYPECLVQGGLENAVRLMRVIANDSQEPLSVIANEIREVLPNVTNEEVQAFLDGELPLNVTSLRDTELEWLYIELNDTHRIYTETTEASATRIYDLSTILDAADSRIPTRGVIATRPFNLDAPDVLKTITDIKIRGQYARGAVKYILLGSMDGINFYVIGTKRGKAWKMFRLIILADLDPTERISWVDVVYEEKFTNRLR